MSNTVTITAYKPRVSVSGLLSEVVPVPSDGYGGWDQKPHPKRKASTEFGGSAAFTMPLGIVFDRHAINQSVQTEVTLLSMMAQPSWNTGVSAPPYVTVRGPVWWSGRTWVIQDIQWSDDPKKFIRNSQGILVRSEATLSLLEYVPTDLLDEGTSAALEYATKSAATERYVVKSGDTLTKIANRFKVKGGWRELAKLQSPVIRDPKSIKKGQVIRVPR